MCRAHDLDNLYIVDASVLPTSAAVNPSLTIAALALRTAEHIMAKRGMKRALITGGQQGIGLGIAKALQGAGFEIALAAELPADAARGAGGFGGAARRAVSSGTT